MNAISVENVWKRYRKGQTGYHTLREDFYNLTGRLLDFGGEKKRDADTEHIWALRDVSFEVKPGERVGIIGRNGSGKTTLLRLLAGITRPTHGKIRVRGRLGVLIEIMAGFHPELTGRENIYLNGAIMGMSRKEIKQKFDEIVAFAELENFIDTPIKRYSSGMHVRLGFAVAAHLDPDVLLIDEVLAVGDAAFQKKCLCKMGTASDEGRTVVFVSHNMTAIRTLCERAILLREGAKSTDDTVDRAVSDYLEIGLQGRSKYIWEDPAKAPGNEVARLRSVSICNDAGITTNEIDSHKPFDIVIELCNLSAGAKLGATVSIYNKEGICVIGSLSNHEPRWHGRPHPVGLFKMTCHMPGDLLPEGDFDITIRLWSDNYHQVCVEENIVGFHISEGLEGVRGDYFGGWISATRPKLDWTTTHVDS